VNARKYMNMEFILYYFKDKYCLRPQHSVKKKKKKDGMRYVEIALPGEGDDSG
jgi:hypothetical protein